MVPLIGPESGWKGLGGFWQRDAWIAKMGPAKVWTTEEEKTSGRWLRKEGLARSVSSLSGLSRGRPWSQPSFFQEEEAIKDFGCGL